MVYYELYLPSFTSIIETWTSGAIDPRSWGDLNNGAATVLMWNMMHGPSLSTLHFRFSTFIPYR